MNGSEIAIYHAFPYLRVKGAAQAIEFYTRAFGAVEQYRLTDAGGRIGHAEIKIGDTVIMLADEHPEYGILGPISLGGTTVAMHLHVTGVDGLAERAVAEGAMLTRPLEDQFYGERTGVVRDPFGHEWLIGEQIEAVSPEEMQRRFAEITKKSEG